ncbi:AMP-binding protein [Streptomyces parvulus]|uniref:AMP-dependent synthetase/ligase domain-containing protein n=1 Tax=Streptomyces parvulus TaxID=146923 RepID=A0A369UZQ5_9ACTN|nr:AMP-binding protein [Streptomyces parvulus]RDD85268.1 hypothetical protein DVZ84_30590 [Streptomyces parvulus]
MSSVARTLVDRAHKRPGLRLGTVNDQLRLDEALTLAAGRAERLLDSGVAPGDRVALVASTSTDYLLTWMACVLAGTPVALVNPTYPRDLLAEMLRRLDPAVVIAQEHLADARTSGSADPAGLPGLGAASLDTVSYMHTSGTSGPPKFCVQTNEYFRRLAAAMGAALELTPADRVLAPLPLFHINPMGYGILTALYAGADALAVEKFSASRFWPDAVRQGVTALVLHAPPVEILKRATTAEDAAGHRIRTMFYADGAFLERFSVPAAVSGYGSTEAAGVTHLRRWSVTDHLPPDGMAAPLARTSNGASTATSRFGSESASGAHCSAATSPRTGSTPPGMPRTGSTRAISAASTPTVTWCSWNAARNRSVSEESSSPSRLSRATSRASRD